MLKVAGGRDIKNKDRFEQSRCMTQMWIKKKAGIQNTYKINAKTSKEVRKKLSKNKTKIKSYQGIRMPKKTN